MRTALVLGFLGLVVTACRSTSTDLPPDVRPQSRAGVCAPSSVARSGACPQRVVAPGTGSSPEGCKSDADCKNGIDGRCVGLHVTSDSSRAPASNLLAAPPPPPLRSNCVYDRCREDKDCGGGARCECRSGVGSDRNECRMLDACVSDRDCTADTLCACGSTPGVPNTCAAGNCRTDADCNGLGCEPDANGAKFCRSAHDKCKSDADCPKPSGYGSPICVFKSDIHARACDVLLPAPPG